MRCLTAADSHAERCTDIAKTYLQCRMDKCGGFGVKGSGWKSGMDCEHASRPSRLAFSPSQWHPSRNLMAKQDFRELGLEGVFDPAHIATQPGQTRQRGESGFVAGVRMETGALPNERTQQ